MRQWFFDPLYNLNHDLYRPGAHVDVELAGIAHSLRIVPHGAKLQTAVGYVPMDGAAVLLSARKNDSHKQAGLSATSTLSAELTSGTRFLSAAG